MKYERLKSIREDKDLKQKQVAAFLNISQRAYSSYETGHRGVPCEVLDKLADFYHTSTDYLLGRTDVASSYPASTKNRDID